MGKVLMQCPSCGGQVELGDIECSQCGVNLKSGESYETRVKQAKGKAIHPEHFTGRIYVGLVFVFGLCVFAGYMYQRVVEATITETSKEGLNLFQYPVWKMQEIDDLVAAGDQEAKEGNAAAARESYGEARKRMQELIQWLGQEADAIKPKQPFALSDDDSRRRRWRPEPEYNKRVAKRLLKNLKAKAEHRLKQMPVS